MFKLGYTYFESAIVGIVNNKFHFTHLHALGHPAEGQSFLVLNHYNEEHSYSFILQSIISGQPIYRCVDVTYQEYSL